MTDPKEIKQRAEESFKKRLGTLGYTMVQNSINPYTDGYQDCYQELEKENAERKDQVTKAKEIIGELNEGLDKLYLSGLSDQQIAFVEQLQDKAEQFLWEMEK